MDQDTGLFNVFSWFCRTRRRSLAIGRFSLLISNWESRALPTTPGAVMAQRNLTPTCLLFSHIYVRAHFAALPHSAFFPLPHCVHRSSPKLHPAKPTDPIKYGSPCEHWNPCLQLFFPHLLALTRTFLPQIISPLSHSKIGPADFQLIPADLFICIDHPAIL